jgi:glycosyltransferase involved in cell wall biosynthesis
MSHIKPKIIVSHPTGNSFVRAALDSFVENDFLEAFYTCIATQNNSIFKVISEIPGLSEFKRRSYNESITPFIHAFPTYELMRLLSTKAGFKKLIAHEVGPFSVDAIYRELDLKVAKAIKNSNHYNSLYAYEDGALHSFKAGKLKGLKCLYDLPIGYWKAARVLMSEEIEKRPEWAATLSGFNDSEAKTNRKDEELALADHIFVASSFTASTLKHYNGPLKEISVVPYGFPDVKEIKSYKRKENQKLKLLFVGGLSQRKGIADVFDAVEPIRDFIELTVVGHLPNCDVPVLT